MHTKGCLYTLSTFEEELLPVYVNNNYALMFRKPVIQDPNKALMIFKGSTFELKQIAHVSSLLEIECQIGSKIVKGLITSSGSLVCRTGDLENLLYDYPKIRVFNQYEY